MVNVSMPVPFGVALLQGRGLRCFTPVDQCAGAWRSVSPRSTNSSRSSVMPTERPAVCAAASGVTGQLSTLLILAIFPAGEHSYRADVEIEVMQLS